MTHPAMLAVGARGLAIACAVQTVAGTSGLHRCIARAVLAASTFGLSHCGIARPPCSLAALLPSISESRLALCSLLLAHSASICDTLFALCSLLAYASITEAVLALCLVLLLLALRVETLLAPSMLLVLSI